ncbi:hypothetical protein DYB28_002923 [Aphanomyces astaci]|uniref:Uncharacterized protein n=1 Tax=Aphanomyces astaci TaxID=112090 RepID=A0A9X8E9A9_APHAT|nr:hypothetical protein DYB28_002923 [Aphanomyces astaci]
MFFITSLAYSGLPYAWIYYTVWGFTLQTIYFVWALVDQWHRRSSWGRDVAMDRKLRYLNACFDASVTVSALVSMLFWVAVHPVDPTFVLYWNVYVQHGANVLILLVEFSLNSFTIRWKSVGFVVLFPVLYAVVTWIGHISWHQSWPYFFMDLSSPYAPLWYAAVAAVHVVLHLVMVGLSQIKRTFEPNQCPHHATTADYLPVSPASSDNRA